MGWEISQDMSKSLKSKIILLAILFGNKFFYKNWNKELTREFLNEFNK